MLKCNGVQNSSRQDQNIQILPYLPQKGLIRLYQICPNSCLGPTYLYSENKNMAKDTTAKKQFTKTPLVFRPINGVATILRGGKFPVSGKTYIVFQDKSGAELTFSPRKNTQAERLLSKYSGIKAPVSVVAKWIDGELSITEA